MTKKKSLLDNPLVGLKPGKGTPYTAKAAKQARKRFKKVKLADMPAPSVTPLSSSARAGVTPDLDDLPGTIVMGTKVTCQTLIGVSRHEAPPYSHGNCFSLAVADGPDLRIVNFKLENLEALMAMPAPITFPIRLRRLDLAIAVIDDPRIPEAWYDQHWCETCCPRCLLPLPQQLARSRSILSGRIKRSEPIEDGPLKGMVMESQTIGGIQGRQILIPALHARLEAVKAAEAAWYEAGWPENYQPLLDTLAPALATYLRAIGFKLPAVLGDLTRPPKNHGEQQLSAYLTTARKRMVPNGYRIVNWFHDRLETTCWKGTQPWEPKWS